MIPPITGMLVLDRYRGEDIIINGNITVRVLEVRGRRGEERVRIGVAADRSVPILRGELVAGTGTLPGEPAAGNPLDDTPIEGCPVPKITDEAIEEISRTNIHMTERQ